MASPFEMRVSRGFLVSVPGNTGTAHRSGEGNSYINYLFIVIIIIISDDDFEELCPQNLGGFRQKDSNNQGISTNNTFQPGLGHLADGPQD
jgi:hypothetical protein